MRTFGAVLVVRRAVSGVTLVATLACGQVRQAPNNPHVPPATGPWFEGWYVRLTDTNGKRSIAVIGASQLPDGQSHDPGAPLQGYLNILTCEGDGAPTLSHIAFPQQTYLTVRGVPLSASADRTEPSDFEWRAAGYGTITENSVNVLIPGTVELSITSSKRLPWNTRKPDVGPEGRLVDLALPLHWHVHSLGSQAEYTMSLGGGGSKHGMSGTGYAHWEKNWGEVFPASMVWAQGIAAGNVSQFVLGISDRKAAPGASIPTWMVALRSPRLAWNLSLAGLDADIRTWADPARGLLVIIARDRFRELRVISHAPASTFASEATPAATGFTPDTSHVSFSANALVSAYVRVPRHNGTVSSIPVEHRLFRNTALEFGGSGAARP